MKMNTVYKILAILWKNAGKTTDLSEISSKAMKISYEEWVFIMRILVKKGYIEGIVFDQTLSDRHPKVVDLQGVEITMDGIEYLETNSAFKDIARKLMETGEFLISVFELL